MSRGTLRVALLQTAPRYGHVAANLAELAAARADAGPADLAVSAELSATGYGFDPHHPDWLLSADDARLAGIPSGTGVGYAERAWQRHDGRAPEPASGGATALPRNAYQVVGREVPVQHKLHPVSYAPWNEHLAFTPGDALHVTELAGVRLATLICNDMWHPVMPWSAVHAGAEVLLVPVASLEGGDVRRTWRVIVEHTARLLQCYVVFVNRCGTDGGASFWGGSCVVAPDGAVLGELGGTAGTSVVELDLARLREQRAEVPILRESRPELVARLVGQLPGVAPVGAQSGLAPVGAQSWPAPVGAPLELAPVALPAAALGVAPHPLAPTTV